jgi:hypothetical protein
LLRFNRPSLNRSEPSMSEVFCPPIEEHAPLENLSRPSASFQGMF